MKKSLVKKIGLKGLGFIGNKLEQGAFFVTSFYLSNKYLKESKSDLDYVKKMNASFPYGFSKFLPKKYLSNKECLMYISKKNDLTADLINNLPQEIKDDKDFIVDLLMVSSIALLNKEIIKIVDRDKELVEKLLEKTNAENKNRFFIEYSKWKNNKEIMKKAIELNTVNLYYMGEDLLNDKDFIIENKAYIYSLQLGNKLRKNKKDVLDLVKNNSSYYPMIDESLKADKDVLDVILLKYHYDIVSVLTEGAIKKIKKDKEFILKVLEFNPEIMKIVDDKLRKDDDIINKMLEFANVSLEFVAKNKYSDDVIKIALKKNGSELRLLKDEQKTNTNIEIALKNCPLAIKFITKDKNEWAEKYFNEDWMVLIYLNDDKFKSDNDIINLLEKLSKNYFTNEWFMYTNYNLKNIFKIEDYCELLLEKLSNNLKVKEIIKEYKVYNKTALNILKNNENFFSDLINKIEKLTIEEVVIKKPEKKVKKINKF